MILKINEKITDDVLDRLITVYNEFDPQKEQILIYLASRGGDYVTMEAILDLINRYKTHTTIVAYSLLASCAFELFFRVKCKKELIGGCMGIYHQANIAVQLNENWKPIFEEDVAKEKYMKSFMKNATMSLCEQLCFTDKEIAKLKSGGDVWFQPDRMNEFLKLGT